MLARKHLGRRALLGTALAGGLAASGRSRAADPVTLNVSGYGGVLNDYLMKTFGVPFEQQTGIKVNWGANASLALAKLQTATGGPAQWDIIVLTGAEYVAAIEQNLIAPYDYSIIESDHIPPEYKGSHGVKLSLYLFSMCWDTKQIPDDQAPKTWAEFWDTGRFKGKRVALFQRVRRQRARAGAAGRRRGAGQALSARRGPGADAASSGWGGRTSSGTRPTRSRSSS